MNQDYKAQKAENVRKKIENIVSKLSAKAAKRMKNIPS